MQSANGNLTIEGIVELSKAEGSDLTQNQVRNALRGLRKEGVVQSFKEKGQPLKYGRPMQAAPAPAPEAQTAPEAETEEQPQSGKAIIDDLFSEAKEEVQENDGNPFNRERMSPAGEAYPRRDKILNALEAGPLTSEGLAETIAEYKQKINELNRKNPLTEEDKVELKAAENLLRDMEDALAIWNYKGEETDVPDLIDGILYFKFAQSSGPYKTLSNFFNVLLNIGNENYISVEHYFQAMKFKIAAPQLTMRTKDGTVPVWKAIKNAAHPAIAFGIANDNYKRLTPDQQAEWLSKRDDVMIEALVAKFVNTSTKYKFDPNQEAKTLGEWLVETGDIPLVHIEHVIGSREGLDNRRPYWGAFHTANPTDAHGNPAKYHGENRLGQMLGEIRQGIREGKYRLVEGVDVAETEMIAVVDLPNHIQRTLEVLNIDAQFLYFHGNTYANLERLMGGAIGVGVSGTRMDRSSFPSNAPGSSTDANKIKEIKEMRMRLAAQLGLISDATNESEYTETEEIREKIDAYNQAMQEGSNAALALGLALTEDAVLVSGGALGTERSAINGTVGTKYPRKGKSIVVMPGGINKSVPFYAQDNPKARPVYNPNVPQLDDKNKDIGGISVYPKDYVLGERIGASGNPVTTAALMRSNGLSVALSDVFFITHAASWDSTQDAAKKALQAGKPVVILDPDLFETYDMEGSRELASLPGVYVIRDSSKAVAEVEAEAAAEVEAAEKAYEEAVADSKSGRTETLASNIGMATHDMDRRVLRSTGLALEEAKAKLEKIEKPLRYSQKVERKNGTVTTEIKWNGEKILETLRVISKRHNPNSDHNLTRKAELREESKAWTDTKFKEEIAALRREHEGANQIRQLSIESDITILTALHAEYHPSPSVNPTDYDYVTPLTEEEQQVQGGVIGLYNYNSFEEFHRALVNVGAKVYVDVRLNGHSVSRNESGVWETQWYDSQALREALEARGIKYITATQFAPSRANRNLQQLEDQLVGLSRPGERGRLSGGMTTAYHKFLKDEKADIGMFIKERINLDIGIENVEGSSIIFGCVEHETGACHRSILGEVMRDALGLTVNDIHAGGLVTAHRGHRHVDDTPKVSPAVYPGNTRVMVDALNKRLLPHTDSQLELIDYLVDSENRAFYARYRHADYPMWEISITKTEDGKIQFRRQAPQTEAFERMGEEASEFMGMGSNEYTPFISKNPVRDMYEEMLFDEVDIPYVTEHALRAMAPSLNNPGLREDTENIESAPDDPLYPARGSLFKVRRVRVHPETTGLEFNREQRTVGEKRIYGEEFQTADVDRSVRIIDAGQQRGEREPLTEYDAYHYSSSDYDGIEVRLSPSGHYLSVLVPKGSRIELPYNFDLNITIRRSWQDFRASLLYARRDTLIPIHDDLYDYLSTHPDLWHAVGLEALPADGLPPSIDNLPKHIRDAVYGNVEAENAEADWQRIRSFMARMRLRKEGRTGLTPSQSEIDAVTRFVERVPDPPNILTQAYRYLKASHRAAKHLHRGIDHPALVPEYEEFYPKELNAGLLNEDTNRSVGDTDQSIDVEFEGSEVVATGEVEMGDVSEEGEVLETQESDTTAEGVEGLIESEAEPETAVSEIREDLEGTSTSAGAPGIPFPSTLDDWYQTYEDVATEPENGFEEQWEDGTLRLSTEILTQTADERWVSTGDQRKASIPTMVNQIVFMLKKIRGTAEIPQTEAEQKAESLIEIYESDFGEDSGFQEFQLWEEDNAKFKQLIRLLDATYYLVDIHGDIQNFQLKGHLLSSLPYGGETSKGSKRRIDVILTNTGQVIPANRMNMYVVDPKTKRVHKRPGIQQQMLVSELEETDRDTGEVRKVQRFYTDNSPGGQVLEVIDEGDDTVEVRVDGTGFTAKIREHEDGHRVDIENRKTGKTYDPVRISGVDDVPMNTTDKTKRSVSALALALRTGLFKKSSPVPLGLFHINMQNEGRWDFRLNDNVTFETPDGQRTSSNYTFSVQAVPTPQGFVYRVVAWDGVGTNAKEMSIFRNANGPSSSLEEPLRENGEIRQPHEAVLSALWQQRETLIQKNWGLSHETETANTVHRPIDYTRSTEVENWNSVSDIEGQTDLNPNDIYFRSWDHMSQEIENEFGANIVRAVESAVFQSELPMLTREHIATEIEGIVRSVGAASSERLSQLLNLAIPGLVRRYNEKHNILTPTNKDFKEVPTGSPVTRRFYTPKFADRETYVVDILEGGTVAEVRYKEHVIGEIDYSEADSVWGQIEKHFYEIIREHSNADINSKYEIESDGESSTWTTKGDDGNFRVVFRENSVVGEMRGIRGGWREIEASRHALPSSLADRAFFEQYPYVRRVMRMLHNQFEQENTRAARLTRSSLQSRRAEVEDEAGITGPTTDIEYQGAVRELAPDIDDYEAYGGKGNPPTKIRRFAMEGSHIEIHLLPPDKIHPDDVRVETTGSALTGSGVDSIYYERARRDQTDKWRRVVFFDTEKGEYVRVENRNEYSGLDFKKPIRWITDEYTADADPVGPFQRPETGTLPEFEYPSDPDAYDPEERATGFALDRQDVAMEEDAYRQSQIWMHVEGASDSLIRQKIEDIYKSPESWDEGDTTGVRIDDSDPAIRDVPETTGTTTGDIQAAYTEFINKVRDLNANNAKRGTGDFDHPEVGLLPDGILAAIPNTNASLEVTDITENGERIYVTSGDWELQVTRNVASDIAASTFSVTAQHRVSGATVMIENIQETGLGEGQSRVAHMAPRILESYQKEGIFLDGEESVPLNSFDHAARVAGEVVHKYVSAKQTGGSLFDLQEAYPDLNIRVGMFPEGAEDLGTPTDQRVDKYEENLREDVPDKEAVLAELRALEGRRRDLQQGMEQSVSEYYKMQSTVEKALAEVGISENLKPRVEPEIEPPGFSHIKSRIRANVGDTKRADTLLKMVDSLDDQFTRIIGVFPRAITEVELQVRRIKEESFRPGTFWRTRELSRRTAEDATFAVLSQYLTREEIIGIGVKHDPSSAVFDYLWDMDETHPGHGLVLDVAEFDKAARGQKIESSLSQENIETLMQLHQGSLDLILERTPVTQAPGNALIGSYLFAENRFIRLDIASLEYEASENRDAFTRVVIQITPRYQHVSKTRGNVSVEIEIEGEVENQEERLPKIAEAFVAANYATLSDWFNPVSEQKTEVLSSWVMSTGNTLTRHTKDGSQNVYAVTEDIQAHVRSDGGGKWSVVFTNTEGERLYEPQTYEDIRAGIDEKTKQLDNYHDADLIENVDVITADGLRQQQQIDTFVDAETAHDALQKAVLQKIANPASFVAKAGEAQNLNQALRKQMTIDAERTALPFESRTISRFAGVAGIESTDTQREAAREEVRRIVSEVQGLDLTEADIQKLADSSDPLIREGVFNQLRGRAHDPVAFEKARVALRAMRNVPSIGATGRADPEEIQRRGAKTQVREIYRKVEGLRLTTADVERLAYASSPTAREQIFNQFREMAEDPAAFEEARVALRAMRGPTPALGTSTGPQFGRERGMPILREGEVVNPILTDLLPIGAEDIRHPETREFIANFWKEFADAFDEAETGERRRLLTNLVVTFEDSYRKKWGGASYSGVMMAIRNSAARAGYTAWLNKRLNKTITKEMYADLVKASADTSTEGDTSPHLAYVAQRVANVAAGDIVHVESAGDGNVATFIGDQTQRAFYIDGDPLKRSLFGQLFPHLKISENLASLDNPLPDVVITQNSDQMSPQQIISRVATGGRVVIYGDSDWHRQSARVIAQLETYKSVAAFIRSLPLEMDPATKEMQIQLFQEWHTLGKRVSGSLAFIARYQNAPQRGERDYGNATGVVIVIDNIDDSSVRTENFNLTNSQQVPFETHLYKINAVRETRQSSSRQMLENRRRVQAFEKKKKEAEQRRDITLNETGNRERGQIFKNYPDVKLRVKNVLRKAQNGNLIPKGTRFNSVEELAVIADIARNPNMATTQVLLVQDGVVVGNVLGGIRTGEDMKAAPADVLSLLSGIETAGYDLIAVSNRPSGDTTISPEDQALFEALKAEHEGFMYLLIKNGETYSYKDGEVERQNVLLERPADSPRPAQTTATPWREGVAQGDANATMKSLHDRLKEVESEHLNFIRGVVDSEDNWAVVALMNQDGTLAELIEIPNAFTVDPAQAIAEIKRLYGGADAYLFLSSAMEITDNPNFFENTDWGTYLSNNPDIRGHVLVGAGNHHVANRVKTYDLQPQSPQDFHMLAKEVAPQVTADLPAKLARLIESNRKGNLWEQAKALFVQTLDRDMTRTQELSEAEETELRHHLNIAWAKTLLDQRIMAEIGTETDAAETFRKLQEYVLEWQQKTTIPLNGPGMSIPPSFAYLMNYVARATENEVVVVPNAGEGMLGAFASYHSHLLMTEPDPTRRAQLKEVLGYGFINDADGMNLASYFADESLPKPGVVLVDARNPDTFWNELNQALHTVEVGGRVVAHVNLDGVQDMDAYREMANMNRAVIKEHYQLRFFGNFDGRMMLVVDRVEQAEDSPVIQKKYEDAEAFLKDLTAVRETRVGRPIDTQTEEAPETVIDTAETAEDIAPTEAEEQAKHTKPEVLDITQEPTHREWLEEIQEALGTAYDLNSLEDARKLYDDMMAVARAVPTQNRSEAEIRKSVEDAWDALLGFTPDTGWERFIARVTAANLATVFDPNMVYKYKLYEFLDPGTIERGGLDLENILDTRTDEISTLISTSYKLSRGRDIRLMNETIADAEDAAILFQPFRNPGYEQYMFIGVDADGKVIKPIALTSKNGYGVSGLMNFEIQRILTDNPEVKGFWIAHNHPEMVSTPGASDMNDHNLKLNTFGEMYLGSVNTDTGEFSADLADGTEIRRQKFTKSVDEEYLKGIEHDGIIGQTAGRITSDVERGGTGRRLSVGGPVRGEDTGPEHIAGLVRNMVQSLNNEQDLVTLVFVAPRIDEPGGEPRMQVVGYETHRGLQNTDPETLEALIRDRNSESGAFQTYMVVSNPSNRQSYDVGSPMHTVLSKETVVSGVYVETNEADFPFKKETFSTDTPVQQGLETPGGDLASVTVDLETGQATNVYKQQKFTEFVLFKYLASGKAVDWNEVYSYGDRFGLENPAQIRRLVDEAFTEWLDVEGFTERIIADEVDTPSGFMIIDNLYRRYISDEGRRAGVPAHLFPNISEADRIYPENARHLVKHLTFLSMNLEEGETLDISMPVDPETDPIVRWANARGNHVMSENVLYSQHTKNLIDPQGNERQPTTVLEGVGGWSARGGNEGSSEEPLANPFYKLRHRLAPGGRLIIQVDGGTFGETDTAPGEGDIENEMSLAVTPGGIRFNAQVLSDFLAPYLEYKAGEIDVDERNRRWEGLTENEQSYYQGMFDEMTNPERYTMRSFIRTGRFQAQIVIDKVPNTGEVGVDLSTNPNPDTQTLAEKFTALRYQKPKIGTQYLRRPDKTAAKAAITESRANPAPVRFRGMSIEANVSQARFAARAGNVGRTTPSVRTTDSAFGRTRRMDYGQRRSIYPQIMVSGIDGNITRDQLMALFQQQGRKVTNVNIDANYEGNIAWVIMEDRAEAEAAIKELNGHVVGNTVLQVEEVDQDVQLPDETLPTGNPDSLLAWDMFLNNPFLPKTVRKLWMGVFDIQEMPGPKGERTYVKSEYPGEVDMGIIARTKRQKDRFWSGRGGEALSRPIDHIARWGKGGELVAELMSNMMYDARGRGGKGNNDVKKAYARLRSHPSVQKELQKGKAIKVQSSHAGFLPSWVKKVPGLKWSVDEKNKVERVVHNNQYITEQGPDGRWYTELYLSNTPLLDAWVNSYFNTQSFAVFPDDPEVHAIVQEELDGIKKIFDLQDQELVNENEKILATNLLTPKEDAMDITDVLSPDNLNTEESKERVKAYAERFNLQLPENFEVYTVGKKGTMRQWVIIDTDEKREVYRIRQFDSQQSVIAKARRKPDDLEQLSTSETDRHHYSMGLYEGWQNKTLIYEATPRDPVFSKKSGVHFQLYAGRPHDMPLMINWASMDPYAPAGHSKQDAYLKYRRSFYEINRNIHKNNPGWRYNGREWTEEGLADEILKEKFNGFNNMFYDPLEDDSELVFPHVAFESLPVLGEYAEKSAQRVSEILHYGQDGDVLKSTLDELVNPDYLDLPDLAKSVLKLRRSLGHDDFVDTPGDFFVDGNMIVPFARSDDRVRVTKKGFDKMTAHDWQTLVDAGVVTQVNLDDGASGFYAWADPEMHEGEMEQTASWEGGGTVQFTIAPNARALVDTALLNIREQIFQQVTEAKYRYATAKETLWRFHTWNPKLLELVDLERKIDETYAHPGNIADIQAERRYINNAFSAHVEAQRAKQRNVIYRFLNGAQNLAVFLLMRLSSAAQLGTAHNPVHRVGLANYARGIRDELMDESQRDRVHAAGAYHLELNDMIGLTAESVSQENIGWNQKMLGSSKYFHWGHHGGAKNFLKAFYNRGNWTPFAWLERRLRGTASLGGKHLTKQVLKELLIPNNLTETGAALQARQEQNKHALTELNITIPRMLDAVLELADPETGEPVRWTEELIDQLTEMTEKEALDTFGTQPHLAAVSRLTDRVMAAMPDYVHYAGTRMHTPRVLQDHPFLRVMVLFQTMMIAQSRNMLQMVKYSLAQMYMPAKLASREAAINGETISFMEQVRLTAPEMWRRLPHFAMSGAAILTSGFVATVLMDLARGRMPDDEDLTAMTWVTNAAVFGAATGYVESAGHYRGFSRQVVGPLISMVETFIDDPAGSIWYYGGRPPLFDFRGPLGFFMKDGGTPHDIERSVAAGGFRTPSGTSLSGARVAPR